MSRPASYREQKACITCRHSFISHADIESEARTLLLACAVNQPDYTRSPANTVMRWGVCDEWEGEEGGGDDKPR